MTTDMKLVTERPILFNGAMVRSILEGRKTQTRRMVAHHVNGPADIGHFGAGMPFIRSGGTGRVKQCPFGQPGDQLWVRETTVRVEEHGYIGPVYLASENGRACLDGGLAPAPDDMTEVEPWEIKLRPAIHMPKTMARIWLEITNVRVERVRDISTADALAEGIHRVKIGSGYPDRYSTVPVSHEDVVTGQAHTYEDPRQAFETLWKWTGGEWYDGTWVWVIEFKRFEHQSLEAT